VAHTDERGAHRLEASLEKLVDVLLAEKYLHSSASRARPGLDQGFCRSAESAPSHGIDQGFSEHASSMSLPNP